MMPKVRLGDVVDYIGGVTFKPDAVVDFGTPGSVAVMRTKNVQKELDIKDLIAVPRELVKRQEQFLREGDILVSSANSWNLVGKCSYVPKLPYEAAVGGFISLVRPDTRRVEPKYLHRWLAWDATQLDVRALSRQTTNIANLPRERFLDLELPLPTLDEQRRIAAILDGADALRRKRREALGLLDALLRSAFLEMFGDIRSRRSPWPWGTCADATVMCSGKSAKSVLSEHPTEFPVYGGNGINGYASEALFHEPVIVVGRVGQQCGVTHMTTGPSWVTDNAIVVRVTNRIVFEPLYLATVLQNAPIRDTVTRLDLPFINQEMLREQPVPLPPIETQRKFVALHAAVQERVVRAEIALADSIRFFNSLLHRAFADGL